jgi:hypothetical protein
MIKTYLIIAALVVIFSSSMLAVNPELADTLSDEDNLFETATWIICVMALIPSLFIFAIRFKEKSGYWFWFLLAILLIAFIGDEISWGMAYFGFTKHRIAGVGFDGVHDILSIGVGTVKLIRDYIRSIGIFDIRSILIITGSATAIAALSYILVKSIAVNRNRIYSFFREKIKWRPFLFLFIGICLVLIAMFIDDDNLVGFPHKAVVEEALELLAAAAFLFSPLSLFKRGKICRT